MTRTIHDRPLARLCLVIATVLHVLGGGVLPYLHSDVVPDGPRTVQEHRPGDERVSLPAGAADHCVLCHAMGTAALPSALPGTDEAETARFAVSATAHTSVPHCPLLSAPARAPPSAA